MYLWAKLKMIGVSAFSSMPITKVYQAIYERSVRHTEPYRSYRFRRSAGGASRGGSIVVPISDTCAITSEDSLIRGVSLRLPVSIMTESAKEEQEHLLLRLAQVTRETRTL